MTKACGILKRYILLEDMRNDPLKKNAMYILLNTTISTLLGFFFWMIAARVYSANDLGLASATISAIGLIAMIGSLGFSISLIRFLPKAKYPNKIINTSFTITSILSLSLGIVFIFGLWLGLWSSNLKYIYDDLTFSVLFLFSIVALTLNPLLSSVFLARRNAKYILVKGSVIFSVIKLVLVAILSYMTAYGVLLSWSIALIISVTISLVYLLPKLYPQYRLRLNLRMKNIRHMVNYSIGNYIVGLFGSAPGLVLPLIIIEILPPEETAYFSISWMIAYCLFTIPIAVSTSLFAEGSIYEQNFKKDLKKAILFMASLLSIGMAVLFLAPREILSIGFGQEYADNGAGLLRIFVISAIPVSINSIYTAIKRVEKKVKEITVIYGFIAIGTIGSTIYFVESMGLNGVAMAWLLTQTIAMFASIIGIYNFFKREPRSSTQLHQ